MGSSDPVCAVTPAPEVVFFQAGPLCLRLPMTITPTLGPCVISARICSFTCRTAGFHEGAPLDFRCLGVYVDSPTP
ncbi:hypothetical protein PAPYR_11948 [Paratrimastix pyriformis]|uniref:Uncharacterized protein n=1 Tax=Paratrimastix pyriformis TaxID=342808 RepID=A0ABQ8U2S3_9EUKA|nr:hypothetical protein PAPYR_11948 [Paratrimastix pyriformis]